MKNIVKIAIGIVGAALIVCGLICVFSPLAALTTVSKIIGIILILSGIGSAVIFFLGGGFLIFSWLALVNAALDIIAGIIFMSYSGTISNVVAVLLGILFILAGAGCAPISLLVKKLLKDSKAWIFVLVFAVIIFILGIAVVKNPALGMTLIAIPLGLILMGIGLAYIFIAKSLLKKGDESEYLKMKE